MLLPNLGLLPCQRPCQKYRWSQLQCDQSRLLLPKCAREIHGSLQFSKIDHSTAINMGVPLFNNCECSQKDLYRNHPSSTMRNSHLSIASSANPTCETVKVLAAADEEVTHDLAKGSRFKSMIQPSYVPHSWKIFWTHTESLMMILWETMTHLLPLHSPLMTHHLELCLYLRLMCYYCQN